MKTLSYIFLSIVVLIIHIAPLTAQVSWNRIITFAGRQWEVKSGFWGPGPNHWSDSPNSVWIDSQGHLHLKIRQIGGTWYAAEVRSAQPTQFGMHRFYVIGRIDTLDINVVFAPFLYANDSTEIDIEFSRWGSAFNHNAQYVLQPGPYFQGDNIHRFTFGLNGTYSTHYINWTSSQVTFKSIHGHYPEPPNPQYYLIQQWTYTGNRNPSESDSLRVHINLWLLGGQPPSNGQEAEVVVSSADLPTVTSVEHIGSDIPAKLDLLQNYPNPFNPETTIEYAIPTNEKVDITIYNTLGQKVKTLVSEHQEAGYYKTTWDGRNELGTPVASGIYVVTVTAGKHKAIRKMLLLK